MSLGRKELDEQATVEERRSVFWRVLHGVHGTAVSLEDAKSFDVVLKGMATICAYTLDECIAQLTGYLRYHKRQTPAWQINPIYFLLVEKTILDLSIDVLMESNKCSEKIAAVIACREQLEEEMTVRRDWQSKAAADYAKYEADYSLAESYIALSVIEATNVGNGSRRTDMTHPDVKKGMIAYKNNLVQLGSLSQSLFAESGSHNEAHRVRRFVELLSAVMPEQATMADDDIQAYITVIKNALDVCAAMPFNYSTLLECFSLAKLSLARLYVKTPASKENSDCDAVQAIYWFEEAKKNGAELSAADENFIAEKSVALEAVVNSTFEKLQQLVNTQMNQPKLSREKKAIFSNLYNLLEDPRVNTSKLSRIVKFKDALAAADHQMLSNHDKPTWQRFVENALSFIALLIPAIIRAYKSKTTYGTYRFWQPASQRATNALQNTLRKLTYT